MTTSPVLLIARVAARLPGPGPWTKTATFLRPFSYPARLARSDAIWAAKGVPLRAPLKPQAPEAVSYTHLRAHET